MIKVAIVGSRYKYWDELDAVGVAKNMVRNYVLSRRDCEFVSGRSPGGGIDEWCELFCKEHNISFTAFPPKANIAKEYFKRNTEIVEYSDIIVAFWDGRSTGTIDTVNKAKRAGKLTIVYTYSSIDGIWTREVFNEASWNSDNDKK